MTSKRNAKGRQRSDTRGRRPRPSTTNGADAELDEGTTDQADPVRAAAELGHDDGQDDGHDDGHDELPHGVWPERPEDVEAELAECLRAAFISVDPDALLRLLRRMPEDALSAVMRSLGMSHAARVNLPMARALQARQRTRADVELIGFIFNPYVHMFDHAHLDAEQWAKLLEAADDDAVTVLRSAGRYFPTSLRMLAPDVPDELERSMLAAIALRSDEWVPALALLARIDERAQALYEWLREENPEYPRTDRSFLDLGVLAAVATRLDEQEDANQDPDAGAVEDAVDDTGDRPDVEDAHSDDAERAVASGAGAGDPATNPLAAAEALDWEAAAVFAERVYAALDDGSAPNVDDLQEIVDFTAAAHEIADALEDLTGAEVARSAAGITAAVAGVQQAGARAAAFGPLTHVSGPPGLEDGLQAVRDLAEAVLAGEAEDDVAESLAALAGLATLGREQRESGVKEYAEIARLESAARAALPPAALSIIPAAMFGDLDLRTPAATAHAEPAEAALPADHTAPAEPTEPIAPLTVAEDAPADEAEPDAESDAESDAEQDAEPESASDDVEDDVKGDVVLDADEIDRFLASEAAGSARVRRPATPDPTTAAEGSARNGSRKDGTPPSVAKTMDLQDAGEDDAPSKDGHEELRRVEAALLEQGRFGLASLLHADPAHAAARRLAAYQARLTSATGDLASAFADDQPLITRDNLGDDLSGQLLAWAAAARVSVLAPASAAHQVLLELGPTLTDYPALTRLGSELASASLNGAIAVLGTSEDVAAQNRAAEAVSAAIAEARELAAVAGKRSVKYAPANSMYAHWMAPDGRLGSLLGAVIADDHSQTGRVQTEIVDIRRNLDRFIDDAFQAVIRGPGKGRRVEHGARQKLVTRIDEVLTIAGRWADAATLVDDLKDTIRGAARARRPLERLRQGMAEVREDVFAELDRMRQLFLSGDGQEPEAAALGSAAVAAATKMVVDTFAAVDGNPPQGGEPSPAWTVRGELLAAPVSLDARTLHAIPDAHVAPKSEGRPGDENGDSTGEQPSETALVAATEGVHARALAAFPAPSFQACYDARRDRAEHDLTEVIVAAASKIEPDTGAALLVERDADVKEAQAEVTAEIDKATNLVNSARRNETLPETVWSAMLARLEGLRSPQRRDFAAIRAAICQVTEVVDSHTAKLVAAIRERVAERAAENELVAAHRDRLMAIVDRGDVAGADEYLEQLTSGAELPETSGESKHLQQFFPQVAELVSGKPTLLGDLHDALAGKAEVTEAVRDLFAMTQTNPTAGEVSARPLGRAAIGAWATLARATAVRGEVANGPAAVKARERSRKLDMDVTRLLKAILAALGYEFTGSVELEQDQPAGRRFATVRSVSGIGKAMSPALGSHMGGPAGRVMRIMLVSQAATPRTLLDWLSDEREDQTVLVIYLPGAFTAEQRRALAAETRRRNRPVAVVVDEAVLAFIACRPEPSVETLAHLVLPFTASSPYRDTPGDTPPEMFYGRVEERRAVIDLFGSSFVSGGRQLGKSALLRSAEREFDNGGHRRAVWVDVRQVGADGHPEALWPVIASALDKVGVEGGDVPAGLATAASVSEQVSRWLAVHDDRALLVLVDEADNFLTADASGGRFPNVGACKKLMEDERRRVKFVFAGLHRTSRFESLSNQPLAHMGKPTVVGPLRPQAAHNMIVRPLAAMGFIFDDPHAQTARIMAATNSVPSLLQLFGRVFIEHLTSRDVVDGPPQVITDADITAVLDDKDLADLFREKYILTLNLDHRYQVIVHAVALAAYDNGVDAGLRLPDLAAQCRQYWPAGFADLSTDYLRGLVTECCDLGLLTLESGRYRMRTPYVLRLLGTADEVAEVLYDADNRLTLPSSLDAGSYRAVVPGTSGGRSPLTALQVGRLFEEPGRTHVVVGTDALAARRTVPYLMAYADEGKAGPYKVQALKNWTPEGLRSAAERLTKPTMLVADMRTASEGQVAALLTAQERAHEAAAAELIVVVVAGMLSVGAWLHHDDQLVELTRVDEAGLRLWCAESDSTFDTAEEWTDLQSATGGWPVLVERALAGDGGARTPTKRIADLREWLGSLEGAQQFVAQCGLGAEVPSSAALAAVFAAVAEWTGESPAAVDELVEVIDDPQLRTMVSGGGYSGIEEALRCLALTGALVQVADRDRTLIAAEPVLARAMAAIRSEGDLRGDEERVTADIRGRK